MLAAIAGAGVGHEHAHFFFRQMERGGKLAANAKRPLRAGPDGELIAVPLCERGAGLKRGVRDVVNVVGLLHMMRSGR